MVLGGCNNAEKQPDVSGIKVTLQTRRLDMDLGKIDTNHVAAGLQQLSSKYPDFLNFYLDTLMGFRLQGNYNDTARGIQEGLRVFLTYKDYRGLFDTVVKHFPNTKNIDEPLTKGFQFMKYYYPKYEVPKVVYLITGLNSWSAFTYENDILCIGLDMYLGEHYPYYASVGIPDYLAAHLRSEYIVSNSFKVLYQLQHPFITEGKTLLEMMLQKGKEQYFLSKIIPFIGDTIKLGYTEKQLSWCKENEGMIYNYFVKGNLLYETNWQKILAYIYDGPTTSGMPSISPGNIGTWVGYQIVKAYMQQHSKTTMDELFKDSDAQRFLLESKYKPK
jgi:hypothetical protein